MHSCPADFARKITFFHTYSSLLDFFKVRTSPHGSISVAELLRFAGPHGSLHIVDTTSIWGSSQVSLKCGGRRTVRSLDPTYHNTHEISQQRWWKCVRPSLSLLPNAQCLVSGFWRDDKLRQIAIPLIQQVPLCTTFSEELDARSTFRVCLEALVEDVSDDVLLKNINLGVLLHTRSENAKVRLFALVCAESLWRAHGGKLLGTSVFL